MLLAVRCAALALALAAAACSGPSSATAVPTSVSPNPVTSLPATGVPATAMPASPAATNTLPASPTAAPAASRTPRPTAPRATVTLLWAPGGPAVDYDDVEEIIFELKRRDIILSGTGDDFTLNVTFDPTVMTVERIMEVLDRMGFPVVLPSGANTPRRPGAGYQRNGAVEGKWQPVAEALS
jgi:hypothetical protein